MGTMACIFFLALAQFCTQREITAGNESSLPTGFGVQQAAYLEGSVIPWCVRVCPESPLQR